MRMARLPGIALALHSSIPVLILQHVDFVFYYRGKDWIFGADVVCAVFCDTFHPPSSAIALWNSSDAVMHGAYRSWQVMEIKIQIDV